MTQPTHLDQPDIGQPPPKPSSKRRNSRVEQLGCAHHTTLVDCQESGDCRASVEWLVERRVRRRSAFDRCVGSMVSVISLRRDLPGTLPRTKRTAGGRSSGRRGVESLDARMSEREHHVAQGSLPLSGDSSWAIREACAAAPRAAFAAPWPALDFALAGAARLRASEVLRKARRRSSDAFRQQPMMKVPLPGGPDLNQTHRCRRLGPGGQPAHSERSAAGDRAAGDVGFLRPGWRWARDMGRPLRGRPGDFGLPDPARFLSRSGLRRRRRSMGGGLQGGGHKA
jgi:hypothetical protein